MVCAVLLVLNQTKRGPGLSGHDHNLIKNVSFLKLDLSNLHVPTVNTTLAWPLSAQLSVFSPFWRAVKIGNI